MLSETLFPCVGSAALNLSAILLPQLPHCRHAPAPLASEVFFQRMHGYTHGGACSWHSAQAEARRQLLWCRCSPSISFGGRTSHVSHRVYYTSFRPLLPCLLPFPPSKFYIRHTPLHLAFYVGSGGVKLRSSHPHSKHSTHRVTSVPSKKGVKRHRK